MFELQNFGFFGEQERLRNLYKMFVVIKEVKLVVCFYLTNDNVYKFR